jgi:hypothetical protein
MGRSTAATHGDADLTKPLTHRGPGNAQLGTDLAQSPTLGVQVGCTLNVHGATVKASTTHTAGMGIHLGRGLPALTLCNLHQSLGIGTRSSSVGRVLNADSCITDRRYCLRQLWSHWEKENEPG